MSTPTDQPDVQNKRFTPLGKEDVAAATASTLIVVDNGSTIANKLADIVMGTGPDRSAQRNAGAAATNAGIVWFIDSDLELPPEFVGGAVNATYVASHWNDLRGLWITGHSSKAPYFSSHLEAESLRCCPLGST